MERAVDSVLNQILSRDLFEIIVTKNFEHECDDQWRRKGVKLVRFDGGGLGPRVADALRHCSGDVVCFLEDDDLFNPRKLSVVYDAFRWNKELGYFFNGIEVVNENLQTVDKLLHVELKSKFYIEDPIDKPRLVYELYRSGFGFHNSAISARKDVLLRVSNALCNVMLSVDTFLFFISCLYCRMLVIEPEKLTLYRSHASHSAPGASLTQNLNKRSSYSKHTLKDFLVLVSLAEGTPLEKVVKEAYVSQLLQELVANDSTRSDRLKEAFRLAYYNLFVRETINPKRMLTPTSVLFVGLLSVVSHDLARKLAYKGHIRATTID